MPTVAEILKASGLTDTEIAALDQKVMTGITGVLTAAEQAQAAAELAQRAQRQAYDEKIAPALDAWGNEAAALRADNAFLKAQAEQARVNGFLPREAPNSQPPAPPEPNRGDGGRYVANANGVPGSPQFMTQKEGLTAINNSIYVATEHQRLYGVPLPDDVEFLAAEAAQQHMPFRDYVAKKYNFEGKKAEIVAAKQKEVTDKLVAEGVEDFKKKWVEQNSNNPGARPPVPSEYTELKRGVDSKQLKDPLSMSKDERHRQTQQMVQKDVAENMAGRVN